MNRSTYIEPTYQSIMYPSTTSNKERDLCSSLVSVYNDSNV